MSDQKTPDRNRPRKAETDKERLRKTRAAEALKRNLLKRKAQARARSDAAKEP